MVFLDIILEVEQDLSYVITKHGPNVIAGTLFNYNVISSNEFELMQHLSKGLPIQKATVVLIEIISGNIKDPVKYEALLNCLEKETLLNYLYNKIKILS